MMKRFLTNAFALIIFLVFFTSCAKKKNNPFSFVQMCDTQIGFGGYEHDLKSFETAVDQINTLNPDFVVICGDLVDQPNDSSYSDFSKIMSGFNMPCYPAPGNHDLGNVPTDSTLNYYRNTIGRDYYMFLHKGYAFIVTNTQLWKADVAGESEKHMNWFKENLEDQRSQNRSVFVIGHYPLFRENVNEKEDYFNLPPDKRKELLKLFEENNVIAYLSGHTHSTVINKSGNILFVSGETTSKNFDKRPLGFRRWNVGDTVTQHFVSLESLHVRQDETESP